jgi:hypothetical protein
MQYLPWVLISSLIAILTGFYYFRKISFAHKLILVNLILIFCSEILGYITSFNKAGNVWVFNIFYLLPELWLMGLAGRMLAQNSVIKKLTLFFIAIGTLLWLWHITKNGVHIFSNWTLLYMGFALTIIYFDLLINSLFAKNLLQQSNFWLSLSVILYFSCAMPYFGMYNYLASKAPNLLDKLFYINSTLNFIRYPLIAFSFHLYSKQKLRESTITA